MGGVWALARLDLRRRWRSLVLIALLVAVSSGVVMAASAGARRAETALDRLHERTDAATVMIPVYEPGFDWSPVEQLPGVEAAARFTVGGVGELGDGISSETFVNTPTDARFLADLERPVVLEGRMFDVDAADEAVVTAAFVEKWGRGIGDTVPVQFPAAGQIGMGDSESGGALNGLRLDLRIVGIVRSPLYADWPGGYGYFIPSPGVATAHPTSYYGTGGREEPASADFLLVRLEGGADAVDRFRARVAEVTGRSDLDVRSLPERYDVYQRGISFESRALLALAAAAALAALFLVGQAVWRHVVAAAEQVTTVRALGADRRQLILASVLPPMASAVLGAVLGAVGATVASRWFPIGTAAAAEPQPGLRADPVVLAVGVLAAIAAVTVVAAVGAAVVTTSVRRRPLARRESAAATAATWAGLPLPLQVGARFALEGGRGRVRVPVRSTLAVAVTGIVGLLGAVLVAHGVQDAVSHPERFGRTFDVGSFTGFGGEEYISTKRVVAALEQEPGITALATPRLGVATDPSARTSVVLLSVEDSPKPMDTVVLDGRMPESRDEVLLAPASLDELGADIGATVRLTGSAGDRSLTVVGTGLMPEGPNNRFDQGGWLTEHGFDALFDGYDFRVVLVAGSGTPEDTGVAATEAVIAAMPEQADFLIPFEPPATETTGAQLRQVRVLPYVLGGFLALLAAGVVAHALVTAVRRRSGELATLRAVGATPLQAAGIVFSQSVVIAVVGLTFGLPLGAALGATVWRSVAASTPLAYVAPTAWWAVLGMVPAAALSAVVFAIVPARRAACARVADVLRTE